MSKPTRWVLVYAFFVAACATGGQPGGGDDDPMITADASVSRQDANTQVTLDASIKLDGGLPIADAFVPPPVDAASGPFCTGNSQCTNAGECCIDLGGQMGFCGPGTVVFGECVPQ